MTTSCPNTSWPGSIMRGIHTFVKSVSLGLCKVCFVFVFVFKELFLSVKSGSLGLCKVVCVCVCVCVRVIPVSVNYVSLRGIPVSVNL